MSVVGVWDAAGGEAALAKLRELVPEDASVIAVGNTVIATTEASEGSRTVVGERPTHSFAEALKDGLVLERGPAWSSPLYYRIEDGRVLFASNLSPLVRQNERVDIGYVGSLVANYVRRADRRTVFSSIAQVGPFETVTFARGRVRSETRPSPAVDQHDVSDIDELAEELRRRVFAAVARACAGRRVAVMMGGLDSSTVLAAAIEGGAKSVVGMTVDFPGPGDDRPHVRTLEKHFGVHVERIRPDEFRDASRKTIVHDEAPSRHPGDCFGLVFGQRARALGAEVVITGGGGDEILGTDLGPAFAYRLRRGDVRAIPRSLRAALPHSPRAWRRLREVAVALLRPHLPEPIRRARVMRRERKAPAWLGPVGHDELRALLVEASHRPTPAETASARYDALARSPHESFFAEVRAQTDASGGAPRVDPIFDDDLVRFIAGIPPDMLFADDLDRGLIRRGMRGRLPESVRLRIDKAKFAPAFAGAVWPIDDLRPFLSFDRLEKAGVVRARPLTELLSNFYDQPGAIESGPTWNYFWPALTAEAFLAMRGS